MNQSYDPLLEQNETFGILSLSVGEIFHIILAPLFMKDQTPTVVLSITVDPFYASLSLCLVSYFFWVLRTRTSQPKDTDSASDNKDITASQKRKTQFLNENYGVYGYRGSPGGYIDEWRPREFPSLALPLGKQQPKQIPLYDKDQPETDPSQKEEVYLDYAGASLPTRSQLLSIARLSSQILANPHSTGPAAARTLIGIQQMEKRVLEHLDGLPGRFAMMSHPPAFATSLEYHPGYALAFTSGTTESLRLVAERFPWCGPCSCCGRRSVFLYAHNSHNSLVGMRNLVLNKGGTFVCRSLAEIEAMSIDDFDEMRNHHGGPSCDQCSDEEYANMIAVPQECNALAKICDTKSISRKARQAQGWYTLVDIAKAASTGPISLRGVDADFAVLSWTKVFGEPTGLGALLVRQSLLHTLFSSKTQHSHYQGGGSVNLLLPGTQVCVPKPDGLAAWTSGTKHFRGILALQAGFEELEKRGGMERIHSHSYCLAKEFVRRLRSLSHRNGSRAIQLFGAWASKGLNSVEEVGTAVAFNVVRDDGSVVGYNEVSKLGAFKGIQFRSGCFCNPGACQEALQRTDTETFTEYEKLGKVCGDHLDILNGKPTGLIRVSFGKDSMWEDMDFMVQFLSNTFVGGPSESRKISTRATTTRQPRTAHVSELYIFPIKSCGGQKVNKWKIEKSSGKLFHDREFALVDASGKAIQLQNCPKMTTISARINMKSQTMTVSAPGQREIVISLLDDSNGDQKETAIKVCGNKCAAKLWGDYGVSEWFRSYLGVNCWLARHIGGQYKLQEQEFSDKRPGFVNEESLLLISQGAVDTLNDVLQQRNEHPTTSRQFRPNIVVHGKDHKIDEEEWKDMTIRRNGAVLQFKSHCARCAMVDFDPENGTKRRTLKALAQYRRRGGQITFGILCRAQVEQHDAWIKVGDELTWQ